MKKLLVSLLALSLIGLSGKFALADNATVNTPKSEKGGEVHPYYGGYKSTRIISATETVVCTGRCLLAGWYKNTGAISVFLRFRDTSVANGSGSQLLPPVRYFVSDTETQRVTGMLPLRTTNGISAHIVNGSGSLEEVTVMYLDEL